MPTKKRVKVVWKGVYQCPYQRPITYRVSESGLVEYEWRGSWYPKIDGNTCEAFYDAMLLGLAKKIARLERRNASGKPKRNALGFKQLWKGKR